jgi:hypothetical protein
MEINEWSLCDDLSLSRFLATYLMRLGVLMYQIYTLFFSYLKTWSAREIQQGKHSKPFLHRLWKCRTTQLS